MVQYPPLEGSSSKKYSFIKIVGLGLPLVLPYTKDSPNVFKTGKIRRSHVVVVYF